MPRTATIKDVAERAGVSPATVSLVLNEVADTRISPATAARVRAAADALGYLPNSLARGLRRRRTDTIALISDTITTTPFALHMIEAVQEVASRHRLLLFLVNTGGNPEVEQAAVAALTRQQVDGFLYACMHHRVVQPPAVNDRPVVLLDARTGDGAFPSVVPDDRGGARSAVAELLDHGHRRVGFVIDPRTTPVAAELRVAGYRDALTAYGVPFDPALIVPAGPDLDGSAAVAVDLHDRAGATALFCFNDRMAVRVYRGLRARGLEVPRDVSVVGFDNQEFVASYAEPPLTTVALPHYAMGEWAARTLVDQLSREDGEPPGTVFEPRVMPCDLVRRGSVAPPRPASAVSRGEAVGG